MPNIFLLFIPLSPFVISIAPRITKLTPARHPIASIPIIAIKTCAVNSTKHDFKNNSQSRIPILKQERKVSKRICYHFFPKDNQPKYQNDPRIISLSHNPPPFSYFHISIYCFDLYSSQSPISIEKKRAPCEADMIP